MKKIKNFILLLFLTFNLSYSMDQKTPEILSLLYIGIDLIESIEINLLKNNHLPQNSQKTDLNSVLYTDLERSKIDNEIKILNERLEFINTSISKIEEWTKEWEKKEHSSLPERYTLEKELWEKKIQYIKNELKNRKIRTQSHIFIKKKILNK